MKKIISILGEILLGSLIFLSALFCLWLLISLLDIATHNIPLRPEYGKFLDWNLFELCFGWFGI